MDNTLTESIPNPDDELRTPESQTRHAYLHTLDGITTRLARLTARVQEVGTPSARQVAGDRIPYTIAAASLVTEVTSTLANLNLWILLANAAEADRAIHDADRAAVSGTPAPANRVDEVAQVIRMVDGSNTLGAGALAEALLATGVIR